MASKVGIHNWHGMAVLTGRAYTGHTKSRTGQDRTQASPGQGRGRGRGGQVKAGAGQGRARARAGQNVRITGRFGSRSIPVIDGEVETCSCTAGGNEAIAVADLTLR